ncbi:TerC family protein [bacterium]|nr:MAG: TerC family protein [bacterium]
MSFLSDPSAWIALITLTILEIVLGIDNIVFISILSGKLPADQQEKARKIGLGLALVSRILLLLCINWVKNATNALFTLPIGGMLGNMPEERRQELMGISPRDLVLLLGGVFLIYKSVKEIHAKLEGEDEHGNAPAAPSFMSVLVQIMILDVVFSLDSVITAVGMADQIGVMIAAVVIAVGFMLLFSGAIAGFVEKHPTVKMLALAFLVLIGVNLISEGAGFHIEKGFTYFAMAFSVGVEMLNLRLRKGTPVHLKGGASKSEP